MNRLFALCSVIFLAVAGRPALAHFTSATDPHLHSSDVWGLVAVAALMVGAVWLDRRSK